MSAYIEIPIPKFLTEQDAESFKRDVKYIRGNSTLVSIRYIISSYENIVEGVLTLKDGMGRESKR